MDKTIYACEEHVDMAIDDYVNEVTEAPEVLLEEINQCQYCQLKAVYVIKRPEEFC
ncbi:MAG: CxxH/CxxC protein [Dethiosulfatibacter sp.]|nr:CxxH/CxxC protein [Dethiosulfatibacter sp.]